MAISRIILLLSLAFFLSGLPARGEETGSNCPVDFSALDDSALAAKGAVAAAVNPPASALEQLAATTLGTYKGDFKKVEAALRAFVELSDEVGFVNPEEFPQWKELFWKHWNTKGKALADPKALSRWGSIRLDSLAARLWMDALQSTATPADPQPALRWLPGFLQNKHAMRALGGARKATATVVNKLSSQVGQAASLVVVSGTISSFMTPFTQPIKEWIDVRSRKITGPLSTQVSKLFTTKADSSSSSSGGVEKKKQTLAGMTQLRTFLDTIGKEGSTPEELSRQMNNFTKQWVDMNQLMVSTFPPNSRLGRAQALASQIRNPVDFASQVAVFDTASEVFHQGVDHVYGKIMEQRKALLDEIRDEATDQLQLNQLASDKKSEQEIRAEARRILTEKQAKTASVKKETEEIDKLLGELLSEQALKSRAVFLKQDPESAKHTARMKELEAQVAAKGVDQGLVEDLLSRHDEMLVAQNQVASSLAMNNIYEIQVPEMNRLLPKGAFSAWKEANRNMGHDFFQAKFKERMGLVMDDMIQKMQSDVEDDENAQLAGKASALKALSKTLAR